MRRGERRRSGRDPFLDQARGVASLIMIHGHALDAWVSAAGKDHTSYAVSRLFATLPLPAFLVLCGVALHHRIAAAEQRAEPGQQLRAGLLRRGTQLVLVGYGVNIVSAWMDGVDSWATVWRADVLQVIGLSICVVGLCISPTAAPVRLRRLWVPVGGVALGSFALFVPLSRWSSATSAAWPPPVQVVAGLLTDVPAITRMPLCPLFIWVVFGLVVGGWNAHRLQGGGSQWQNFALLAVAVAPLLLLFQRFTYVSVAEGTLTRQHWAAVWNLLDYGARGVVLFALSPWFAALLPAMARRVLERLGSASLWAYVVHIPFCYGSLGAGLRSRLTVPEALPWMAALMLFSYWVVLLRKQGVQLLSSMRARRSAV